MRPQVHSLRKQKARRIQQRAYFNAVEPPDTLSAEKQVFPSARRLQRPVRPASQSENAIRICFTYPTRRFA